MQVNRGRLALSQQWTPSHTGTNGGSDFSYLDILPTSHGTFKVTDALGNEYAHGSKVRKYTDLTIEATRPTAAAPPLPCL